MKHWNIAVLCCALACAACFSGCVKPDGLCSVEGTVTLDGQPIENGRINMGPMVGQSGTATGGEITNGKYSFRASEGEMVVTIRATKVEPIENPTADEQAHGITERQVELIPERYNQQSELKATIHKGKNTVDFDLKSEAE